MSRHSTDWIFQLQSIAHRARAARRHLAGPPERRARSFPPSSRCAAPSCRTIAPAAGTPPVRPCAPAGRRGPRPAPPGDCSGRNGDRAEPVKHRQNVRQSLDLLDQRQASRAASGARARPRPRPEGPCPPSAMPPARIARGRASARAKVGRVGDHSDRRPTAVARGKARDIGLHDPERGPRSSSAFAGRARIIGLPLDPRQGQARDTRGKAEGRPRPPRIQARARDRRTVPDRPAARNTGSDAGAISRLPAARHARARQRNASRVRPRCHFENGQVVSRRTARARNASHGAPAGGAAGFRSIPPARSLWTSISNTSISSPDRSAEAKAMTVGSLLRRTSSMVGM